MDALSLSRASWLLALLACGCANPWLPASCGDGLDNDGDGLTDRADPDCRGSARLDTERAPSDAGMDASEARIDASEAGLDAGGEAGTDSGRDAGTDADVGDGSIDAGLACLLSEAQAWVCTPQRQPALCGTSCVDLQNDASHCGGCDRRCEAGAVCRYGRCRTCAAIGPDVVACDGACVEPRSTPRSCGECPGAECADHEICAEGACATPPEARAGDRCSRPNRLGVGAHTVAVYLSALLDAPLPRCPPVDHPPQRGAIIEHLPRMDGQLQIRVDGPRGIAVTIQRIEDHECRCAMAAHAACRGGFQTASLEARGVAGVPLRFLVAIESSSVEQLLVTISAVP